MKVFMPAANEGWIGDVTTKEFRDNTKHEFVSRPEDADVIWMYSKWIANHFPIQVLKEKPCITTVHHIVPEKGIDIAFLDSFTDVYHVPNRITYDMLRRKTEKPITILPYWVPSAFLFIPNDAVDEHCGSLQLPLGATLGFVFGSFQRDTEGATILTETPQPKLEKGPDVLISVLERFWDEDYHLFLAGWRRQYIKSRIPKKHLVDYTEGRGPDGKAFDDHNAINSLYNILRRYDGIYLVTSRYEGGPQAILEAAITGTRILSTSMGIAPEVLHPDCLCGSADDVATIDAFEKKIREGVDWDTVVAHNLEAARALTIEKVIPRYDDLIRRVHDGQEDPRDA